MGRLTLGNENTHPTPSSGKSSMYFKTDKLPYYKDDAGVEHPFVSGGSGDACLAKWTANDIIFPGTTPASANSRNEVPTIEFDDASDEVVLLDGVINRNYSNESVIVDIDWAGKTATTGNVKWNAQFARLAAGGQDLDSFSYSAIQTTTSSTNGTSGILTRTSITFTQAQADSIASGDFFRIKLIRDANDAADTMSGDAQVVAVQLRKV